MHIFNLFFVQFIQFPVLDFGLDHSGSRPFNWWGPEWPNSKQVPEIAWIA